MRFRSLILVGSALMSVVVPTTSAAQGTVPGAARPGADTVRVATKPVPSRGATRTEYRNLRFDEVWTHASGGDWSDALKAMPIAPHVTLSLGGQVRAREEWVHAFTFSNASDSYALSRTLVHADLQAGQRQGLHGRVFAELRDAQGFSRDLPGGVRPADADRSDIQNLFADVGYGRSFVRYGRQEIVSGRDRLIGAPDWVNTRRGTQGLRAIVVHRAVALELLDVRPVVVRQHAVNHADSTTQLRGVTFGSAAGAKPVMRWLPTVWQAFHYDQRIDVAAATHRLTSGGRLQWTLGSTTKQGRSYALETESAMQRGTVGTRDIRAWFVAVEASAQWRGVHGTPTLALGLDAASGDASTSDNTLGAFNALYAGAHQHHGYADVFGRANARIAQLISTWDPHPRLSLRGAAYHVDRLSRRDGVYTKQTVLLRATGSSDALHAGDEFDLTGTATVTRHLKLIAGGAWVEPGEFLRRSTGGARTSQWGFLGSTYTF